MAHPLEEAFSPEPRQARDLAAELLGKRGRKVYKPDRQKISTEYSPSEEDDTIRELMELDGTALYNAPTPEHSIAREKPEHRFLIYLFGQGLNVKQVFMQLGGEWDAVNGKPLSNTGQYSYAWLTQIRRQSWFQAKLLSEIGKAGQDVVAATIQAAVPEAFETVEALHKNPATPPATRLAAANSILDRHLGKASQHIHTTSAKTPADFETDADAIDKELAAIQAQIRNINPAAVVDVEEIPQPS